VSTWILRTRRRTSGCSEPDVREAPEIASGSVPASSDCLSHGIDRAQINETFLLGLPRPARPSGERTLYFPGPEYRPDRRANDVKKATRCSTSSGSARGQ